MSTQVQIRGAVDATQQARTPASREMDFNTTHKRFYMGDGSTLGGIPHINYLDHLNNTFTHVAVTGTNALTGSMEFALTSYTDGLEVTIKPQNNNTGSVTLNLDSVGAVTLKKVVSGSLVDLDEDDLVAGVPARLRYNGTYFIVSITRGGGWSLVASASPSSAASVDFDGLFREGYDYKIKPVNLQPASDGVQLWIRLAADGGSYLSAAGDYEYTTNITVNGSEFQSGGTGSAIVPTTPSNVGNNASESVSGDIILNDPFNVSFSSTMQWNLTFETTSGTLGNSVGSGQFRNATGSFVTEAVDSARVMFSAGNIADGEVRVYEKPL